MPADAVARMTSTRLSLAFLILGALLCAPAAAADEARTNRIKIEYVPPTNPAHQKLYEMLKSRGALEKLQQIFAPFKLPLDLPIKTAGCDGDANAWYERPEKKPSITICYEYVAAFNLTKETTPAGITPSDAIAGQFFYVAAHEMGHAVFDLDDIPIFGRLEDAADQFATYIMLQFGKGQARALIGGAAYAYRDDVRDKNISAPLQAFSSNHGAPQARFYNLLCLAYGADQKVFGDLIEKGYLPEDRAKGCKREYSEVAYAFKHLIRPHVDMDMAKRVLETDWLPRDDKKPAVQ
jgi:hypothetical protein